MHGMCDPFVPCVSQVAPAPEEVEKHVMSRAADVAVFLWLISRMTEVLRAAGAVQHMFLLGAGL